MKKSPGTEPVIAPDSPAMAEENTLEAGAAPEASNELKLLIFNIMGVLFGADMEQIDEMLEPEQAEERQCDIVPFHQRVPLGGSRVVYEKPRILLIRETLNRQALLIDRPENIVNLPVSDIRLFPPLIEARKTAGAVWGVTFVDGEIVLLVDLFKLFAAVPSGENAAGGGGSETFCMES